MKSEDIICGLEFRYGYEADLLYVSQCVREWAGKRRVPTCLPLLLAAFMRDEMLAMFSVSCFARCGLICISSAIVITCAVWLSRGRNDGRRQSAVLALTPSALQVDHILAQQTEGYSLVFNSKDMTYNFN